MSGSSTPKRQLEVDNYEDSQRQNHRLSLKIYQHDAHSKSISASWSSSRSSYGKVSSLKTLSDDVQRMFVGFEEGNANTPERNCLPPLSNLQSISACHFLQVPSSSLTIGSRSQISNTREEEEICFGMLKEVEIKIINNQKNDSKIFDELGGEEDSFAYLDLIFGHDRCDVQFQDINIATMQTKTQHALQQLIFFSKQRVRYKALVPRAEFQQMLDAAMQPLSVDKHKLLCSMNVQVFGARSIANTVAKELSKYHLFLQHPFPVPFNAAYENPQYLNMVGSSFTNGLSCLQFL